MKVIFVQKYGNLNIRYRYPSKRAGETLYFPQKLHEQDNLPSHMLNYIPPWRKGVVFMRVVVVKFPKALCGLMRKIFHMD